MLVLKKTSSVKRFKYVYIEVFVILLTILVLISLFGAVFKNKDLTPLRVSGCAL